MLTKLVRHDVPGGVDKFIVEAGVVDVDVELDESLPPPPPQAANVIKARIDRQCLNNFI